MIKNSEQTFYFFTSTKLILSMSRIEILSPVAFSSIGLYIPNLGNYILKSAWILLLLHQPYFVVVHNRYSVTLSLLVAGSVDTNLEVWLTTFRKSNKSIVYKLLPLRYKSYDFDGLNSSLTSTHLPRKSSTSTLLVMVSIEWLVLKKLSENLSIIIGPTRQPETP